MTAQTAPKWVRQPAIAGRMGGCLCCGKTTDFFGPDDVIAVGFGCAALTCDGRLVWAEDMATDEDGLVTGEQAERLAARNPDHDWQISLQGPMRGRTYQRHAPGQWALIEQNEGFA